MALPPSRDSEGRVATSEDVFFAARSDGSSANSLAKCATGKITTGRNDTDEELVTIRPAVSKSGETLVTVTAPEEFVGPGMTIAIAGLTLKSPLVYVATGQVGFLSDPSLIDLALPVAASSRTDSIELPPLTSYRGGTNVQRRQYLDWLAGGRRDATIPSDYVLLYLQGLERHVLIGRKDFAAVAEELLRLLWFHGPSRLFHDALSSLLLTTVWLGLQRQQISTTLLNDAIRLVGVKSRSCLTTFLAILYQSGQRLSAEMAIKVCACIAQTRGHDFTERHVTLFEERYRRRFLSVYPNGFHLRNELGSEQLEYVPINPLLSDWTAWYPVPVELSLPINLDASVQLQPLMVLWTEVIADLKEQLGEPQPDAECKPASSEIPASPPPTTITPGADLPPVNDELIFQWLQPPTISTPESEPPPNSPPNPKPADAIVQRHPSADTCALVSESELVGIETIPVPFKLSQPESLAILPTASEIVTPTLPTIVTPRADARPSDRAADNSTASLTANEQQLVTIPPVVPPSRRLFLSPPANEKERDTIRRVVPPSGRTTAEQHHLEQELVTIRPAMPAQWPPGMFPPKEPRKLGETPEPIPDTLKLSHRCQSTWPPSRATPESKPDPLKLSQLESLPILPTASKIENPTLPTSMTPRAEALTSDPPNPKTWDVIVQRHPSADQHFAAGTSTERLPLQSLSLRELLSPVVATVFEPEARDADTLAEMSGTTASQVSPTARTTPVQPTATAEPAYDGLAHFDRPTVSKSGLFAAAHKRHLATAEESRYAQELVTIRPAIPPQSSLGMFPPKEPRKLGETPEPIPDPLKLSQPESLPILPTASEIETPTLPTIITLQTETISNDPHVPKTWGTIVQRHTSADGWALVPISELADIEGIPKRSMLSPAECLVIVSAANRRGFALEPDTRITGQQYRWDELVSVFPQSEELPGDLTTYRAASAWLRLGITVALADGEVYYVELSQLFAHLKSQFALSTRDTVRLDHLRYLLTKTRQSDPTVAGRLRDQLDIANRSQLGKFLVSIAEADGDVSPQEQSVLEQIYGELGIPFSLVQHLPVTSSKLLQVDSTESGAPAVANSLPKITTEPVSRRGKIVAWVVTLLDDPDRPFRVRLNLGEHYFVEFPTDGMISRLALSMRRAAQQSADLFNRPTKKVAPPRIRQSRQTTVKKMPPTQLEDQPVMGFGQSQQTSVSESPPAPSLELDFKRVEQIKAETAQVAAFLGEVWRDEDEPSVSNAIVAEPPRVPAAVGSHIELPFEATALTAKATGEARFVALAPRFVPFVERLAKQPQWSRTDLDRLARELGMMVDGAVDAVNEWAHEQFGDLLLIDEGDIFLIQSELLIDHTGPT